MLNLDINQVNHVIPMPIFQDYFVLISRIDTLRKEQVIMTYITEEEEQQFDDGKELTLENSVLDHQHKQRKSDKNGVNGDGLVRGVICQEDNLSEGKIWNSTGRFQGARTPQDRINWLKQLIQYYEAGTYPFIHPTEKVPEKNISKRQYNKLKKVCPKVPEYPKSTHLTKRLKELFDKYKINPFLA